VDQPKNERDVYGLRYAGFVLPLVKAIQQQQEMTIDLQQEPDTPRDKVERIEKINRFQNWQKTIIKICYEWP
jgi:hypothetical protein